MQFFIKHKRKTSILLLLIMLIGLIPVDVLAINNTDVDKNKISQEDMFIYEDEEKTILIGFKGDADVVKIPNQVKKIQRSALKDKNIKMLELNEGLEVIESEAFSNNQILGSIILPSTLTEIEERAFADNLIQKVDFSKVSNLRLGRSAFQDNKISGELDVSNLKEIPKQAFWNNEITDILFNDNVSSIGDEAFANNKLSELSIVSNNVVLGEDVFAGNGRYVTIFSNVIKSEKSKRHQYGHIVNPVNIIIRSVEKQSDGSLKRILSDKRVEFNSYDADNFFALNHESFYKPAYVLGYVIDDSVHPESLVSFMPDKNDFILDIYYKKIPNPEIKINQDALKKLLSNKKEGSNISEEDILSLVSAYDYLGNNISKNIKVSPKEIINAEAKEYSVIYSVSDAKGRITDYKLRLPIAIDPLKIRIAGTEWQLEDFVYEGNAVIDLSDKGREKAKLVPGLAIPHLNPYTMETIEVVRFRDGENKHSILVDDIQEGELVFGDPKSIKVIDDYSFGEYDRSKVIPLTGSLPDMPNLEYIGDWSLATVPLTGTFPNVPKLKHIGDNAFFVSSIIGPLPEMPNLEYVGEYAFHRMKINSQLPNFPKLKYIAEGAFTGTEINGSIPEMPNLKHMGSSAFYHTNISELPPALPELEYIGKHVFRETKLMGNQLPAMPNLKYIEERAFDGSNISGPLPDMPKLEIIGAHAFNGTNISGSLPDMPIIEYIGKYAFRNTQISGQLPDLPKLEYIGDSSFSGSNISGSLPDMPIIEYIGGYAFYNTQISGELPEMPMLKEIGQYTFYSTQISGEIPEMPNLEYIGDQAFMKTGLSGELPDMPMLKEIGYDAFRYTNVSGQLPDMPMLKKIDNGAFSDTQISGELPEMPMLKEIGGWAFDGTQISKENPFYINNSVSIHSNAFKLSNTDNEKMVLLTHDGKDAPGVEESNYHILNPFNIGFVGKDSSGNIIVNETRLLATEDGDNVMFNIPKVEGFVDNGRITISKSDLINGVYTHIYKSIKEELDEIGGNNYQFTFKSTNNKVYYNDNETINSYLSLSTVNEDMLKNGKIELKYNKDIYKDFFVPEIKGVENIMYESGKVIISLDKNLSQGTEIGLPVSFQFKEGVLPEKLFPISAYLLDEKQIQGYGSVSYGINYKEPVYQSIFSDKNKTKYENIIVKNLDNDYKRTVFLYPKVDSFIRDFNSFKVEYNEVKYKSRNGFTRIAKASSPGWEHKDDKYIYEVKNFKGQVDIPRLELEFESPSSTNKAIEINSKVVADVNTSLEDYKYVELKDTNYLNIHVEERSGNILSKEISNPHSNNRQAYFYDNIEEKNHDFEWSLFYNITYNINELTLTDYDLDKRMKYTAIDPNGDRVLVKLLDKDNNVLSQETIREKTQIKEDLQEKVASIELKYYNLRDGNNVKPKVITKLKDVNKDYFNPLNVNNLNRFYNKMKTKAIDENGRTLVGNDYSFVDVVKDNKSLATEVVITSKPIDLSYGKIANTSFYLKSKEFFDKNIEELKYTALIDPSHRLENVLLSPGVIGQYEVSQTENGYTRIDFIFNDLNTKLNSNNSRFKLFDLKTTPKDKSSQDLKVYGLLDSSEDYEVYGQGKGTLEGLDKSKFSYDEAQEKIINGEFFSIQKLIGKGEEVSTRIETKEGESFFYRFEIDNGTATRRENFELIDILPYDNDFNNSHYHNKVDVEKLKNINLPDGFNIQYLNQKDFININKNQIISRLSDANWSNTPTEDTKAIKIIANELEAKGDLIQIDIPMLTKSTLKIEDNLKVNTNQFAYTHNSLGYNQALSNPVEQLAKVEVPKKDIKLKKVSVFMGEKDGVIENVKFVLKDTFGRVIDNASTNSNGDLIFKDIPVGDYTVEEIDTPKGYRGKATMIVKAEDMNKTTTVLDLGEVENHRIDKFDYLFKNVEFIGDLSSIEYSNLKNIYSREVAGAKFIITNTKTGVKKEVEPNRFGEKLTLQPGIHTIEQIINPKDNGLTYKLNSIKYQFEIDKFGKILLGDGNGSSLSNKKEEISNVIYFPNTIDYPLSKIEVFKNNRQGDFLSGAEFTLTNIDTGELIVGTTNSGGILVFKDIKPGLYSLKETKAPSGYIATNQVEIVEIPIDRSITAQYKFMNEKLVVNIHKYKVIADRIATKEMAEEIANNTTSYTDGNIIVKDLGEHYQVREVWKDNNINVNGTNFKTDSNGSTLNIQETLTINKDSVLNISNNTKIPAHYEPNQIDEYVEDYVIKENFDGTIDIDIIVKPLKGSIYVSKYVIDKNNEVGNKEFVNGSKYDLYVDKGNGYELLDNKTIENNNYLLFKDLNPLYKYKVVETFTPEGQEEANPKEYEVILRDDKSYVETVIFRNYIELEAGLVHLNKVDGRTDQALQGVEFEIIDKHGVGVKHTTDSQGHITFEELRHDLAPYIIKEIKAAPGYRISSQTITVTEEDILNEKTFTVKNYKYNETPKTGTNGKLLFFLISIPLIALAYVFNKKKY